MIASTDFRPMVGGVADYLHRVAEVLAASADVTVATTVADRGLKWAHSYKLHPLPPLPQRRLGERAGDGIPFIRRFQTGLHFLRLRRYALEFLRHIDADAAGTQVVIGIWDVAAHFWCEACRMAGVEYCLMAYGVELLIPLYGRLPEWRRADFAGASRVIAVSRATAELVATRLELAKMPAVVNPIAAEALGGPAVERRAGQLRAAIGNGAGPMLLSVGRLVARKGFDTVLESVASLRTEFPSLRYVLIGDGPERPRLEARIRELGIANHVLMLGRADDAAKWAAFKMCDLFVMPARELGGTDWEGFGIVFAEAARAGRAVVAARTGGVADAVIDGETGLLIEPDDPLALTAAIKRLLVDRTARCRMEEAALRVAAERFTPVALQSQMAAGLGWA